jgi:hypothetical protein
VADICSLVEDMSTTQTTSKRDQPETMALHPEVYGNPPDIPAIRKIHTLQSSTRNNGDRNH